MADAGARNQAQGPLVPPDAGHGEGHDEWRGPGRAPGGAVADPGGVPAHAAARGRTRANCPAGKLTG